MTEWIQLELRGSQKTAVYAIRCRVIGLAYVGQSTDLVTRWRAHRWQLETGRHPQKEMQADWLRFGEKAFDWEILEEPPLFLSLVRERDHYILMRGGTGTGEWLRERERYWQGIFRERGELY